MKSMILLMFAFFPFTVWGLDLNYCDVKAFMSHEVTDYNPEGLERSHMFRFGSIHILGLGIGDSEVDNVIQIAKDFSSNTRRQGYCTFYFNKGNHKAEKKFNSEPIAFPKNPESTKEEFNEKVIPHFANSEINFLNCMEKKHYLSFGCDSMKHRGPTVWAALLAASGCDPEKAAAIANDIWGLNGVSPQARLAAAQVGFDYGERAPEVRKKLQKIFNQENEDPPEDLNNEEPGLL